MSDDALFGLPASTCAKLRGVFDSTPGIEAVWVYGSRARGTQRHESDIDLAVMRRAWTTTPFCA